MNQSFKLATTPLILFGTKKIKQLPELTLQFGKKVLIVTGKASFLKSHIAIELFQDLDAGSIENKLIQIIGEPTPDQIDLAVSNYRDWSPTVIVAIGGGSTIDAGKAISAMLCEKGSIKNYLEDVGTQLPSGKKIPLIAIPTTAGTGSETTKNAVITQPGKNGFKKSLRHDNYVPNIALVDPDLCVGCPPSVTAASGMDAYTQLLESYLSLNSNPLTDALALDGIAHLIESIEKAFEHGDNLEARTNMCYAAMLSGITLANAGLGVVHGFAQPLGSIFNVPHGVVCGTLMGSANRVTIEKLKIHPNQTILDKYDRVAQLISNAATREQRINDFLNELDRLTAKFKLKRLSEFGITEADLPQIIHHTGLKYHPVELDHQDLVTILKNRL